MDSKQFKIIWDDGVARAYSNGVCILEYGSEYLRFNLDYLSHSKTTSAHFTRAINEFYYTGSYLHTKAMALYRQIKAHYIKLCDSNLGGNFRDFIEIYLNDKGLALTGDGYGNLWALFDYYGLIVNNAQRIIARF